MGYRELLKHFIRHLEQVAGDNFIDREGEPGTLSKRDRAELRTLAAEIRREAYRRADAARPGAEYRRP